IDRMASGNCQYSPDSDDKTRGLINEAGECMLKASGTVVLTPGTYIIQAMNFQPGDAGKVTIGQFKEFTINSISFEEYNSEEYNQILLEAYEAKVASIPATIVYNEECRRAIRAAMEAYEVLSPELKKEINTPYSVVLDARTEYLAKGKAHVENLISEIGTVDENSGSAISSARVAYNALLSIDGTIAISNYQTLVSAEAAFTQYAVTSCINKINAIGTVTLASGSAIEAARAEYDSLDEEEQKSQITNINVLIAAEARYADLVAASEVDDLIENASLTTLSSLSEVVDAYKALTAAQKELIADKSRKSDIFVAYAEAMIDAIDANITISSADGIYAAEAAYDLLTADEKARVSNYSKLQSALQQIDEIGEARKLLTAEFNATQFTITPTLTGKASISTSVHKNSSLVIVSNFKVKNLTQIDLTIQHSDKS
ncbi:MAG: hypothetical protein K2K15_05225, partial [Anaeroplasmataceae bacterium]|nr:hypothetical protein [Anaeroplasmataceae bacterium]